MPLCHSNLFPFSSCKLTVTAQQGLVSGTSIAYCLHNNKIQTTITGWRRFAITELPSECLCNDMVMTSVKAESYVFLLLLVLFSPHLAR